MQRRDTQGPSGQQADGSGTQTKGLPREQASSAFLDSTCCQGCCEPSADIDMNLPLPDCWVSSHLELCLTCGLPGTSLCLTPETGSACVPQCHWLSTGLQTSDQLRWSWGDPRSGSKEGPRPLRNSGNPAQAPVSPGTEGASPQTLELHLRSCLPSGPFSPLLDRLAAPACLLSGSSLILPQLPT